MALLPRLHHTKHHLHLRNLLYLSRSANHPARTAFSSYMLTPVIDTKGMPLEDVAAIFGDVDDLYHLDDKVLEDAKRHAEDDEKHLEQVAEHRETV